jgi:hypothetical protein
MVCFIRTLDSPDLQYMGNPLCTFIDKAKSQICLIFIFVILLSLLLTFMICEKKQHILYFEGEYFTRNLYIDFSDILRFL